jgi:ectoine hydroxylase-related dioxygenase (phytanoyl-CoA dioxygenase family)
MTPFSLLTDSQLAQYHREGYLIVHGLLTDAEIAAYVEHQAKPKPVGWKLGLRSHTADPQLKYLAHHPRITTMVRQLLGGLPRIVQTMALDKAAAGGTGIALHQDSQYLPTEPNTLMACWLAITDTDEANGGLCVVPGSHLSPLREARKAQDTKEHDSWTTIYELRDRDGREWKQEMFSFEIPNLDPQSIVRLAVPKGGGVFFTGMTIHGSFANRSADRPRRAFATHYVKDGTWVYRCDVQETVAVEEVNN